MSRVRPFDSDGLWLKARLFINRALDESTAFEEAAFWACCSLELLGKAALSRINPALIANPTDDGRSILIASGVIEDHDGFLSVQAKTVWARCSRSFRQFNAEEAREISLGRNAYIHSAAIGFDVLGPAEWWPRFWAQANVLIAHCDSSIEEFVGPTRAKSAEQHLQTNRANLSRRLESQLDSARLRLRIHESGNMTGQMRQQWSRFFLDYPLYMGEVDCPACGNLARVGGEDVEERRLERSDFDEVALTLVVWTIYLGCEHCHLELVDVDLLDAAGIPSAFEVEGSADDIADLYDSEYNNE